MCDHSVSQLMLQMFTAGLVAFEGFAGSSAMPKNTWWVTMAALTDTGTALKNKKQLKTKILW